ncbi:MAG: hypothetical protein QOG91_181 [Candidatus Parcubacteria bacterium]|jgi:glucokinase|nr:hypothetical protein [Candidatus Parcubacteria bacterium]
MILVFDIGGSRTRIARVDAVSTDVQDVPSLSGRMEYETPQNFDEAVEKLNAGLQSQKGPGEEPAAVCGGFPGQHNRSDSVITYAPNLPQWVGRSLIGALRQKNDGATGVPEGIPLLLENDAALAALAEARLGSGKGHAIVVFLTLSTGVGGARVVRGHIDSSTFGFEPGHQIVEWQTGKSLEDFVSGKGIQAEYGMEIQRITDAAARDQIGRILAVGLHNVILHWSPEIVVLGGPVILKQPAIDLSTVRPYVAKSLKFKTVPDIVPAMLSTDAGLIGAALMAQDSLI